MNKNLSSLLACASATFVAFTLALPAFAAANPDHDDHRIPFDRIGGHGRMPEARAPRVAAGEDGERKDSARLEPRRDLRRQLNTTHSRRQLADRVFERGACVRAEPAHPLLLAGRQP